MRSEWEARRDARMGEAMERVVITVTVPGSGTWEFTSESMGETFADVLLWSLAEGIKITIESARKVRA